MYVEQNHRTVTRVRKHHEYPCEIRKSHPRVGQVRGLPCVGPKHSLPEGSAGSTQARQYITHIETLHTYGTCRLIL